MNSTNLTTLKFPYLKYDVTLINQWLTDYSELDCFMFLQHFNISGEHGPSFQLLAYPHGNTQGSTLNYHEVYYDCDIPNALLPFNQEVIELEAPVIMAPNVISKINIIKLIGSGIDTADALIFIPKIAEENRIYYTIKPAKFVNNDYIFIPTADGDDSIDTNPSPPATIESVGRDSE